MLRLFGVPGLHPRATKPLRPLVCLLVARLVIDSGLSLSRHEIAAWLWPASDESHANLALRQLLSAARRWADPLGISLFRATPHSLLRDDRCEATDLDGVLAAAPGNVLEYHGRLLGDFEPGSSLARNWLALERDRLDDRYCDLAVAAADRGGVEGVAAMLAASISLRPYNEAIVRAQMTMSALAGLSSEAPRQLAALAKRLEADLGVEPEPRTVAQACRVAKGEYVPAIPRILILPPVIEAGVAPRQHDVAQGFVDDITLGLCRERTFAVFAPYTARTVGAAGVQADYIVKTRLRPGRVPSFGILLLHSNSGRVVAANEVSFEETQLWLSHWDISQSVALALGQAIARTELNRADGRDVASAYVDYLRGARSMEMHHLASIRRAANYFRKSLRAAPDFVPALGQLARARTYEWLQFMDHGSTRLLGEARSLAARAVRIEPLDEKGHRELGLVALYSWQLDEALDHYAEAERLAPNNADLIADRADVLAHASDWPAAERTLRKAFALNPAAPDEYLWTLGAIYFFTRRYDLAVSTLEQMKNRDLALALTAASAAMAGDGPKAKLYARRTRAAIPTFDPANVVRVAPQRNPADTEHYVAALRAAGL